MSTKDCSCDGESRCINHRIIVGYWQIRLQSIEYSQDHDYWKEVHATDRSDAEAKALIEEPDDAYVCEVFPPQKPSWDGGFDSGLAYV